MMLKRLFSFLISIEEDCQHKYVNYDFQVSIIPIRMKITSFENKLSANYAIFKLVGSPKRGLPESKWHCRSKQKIPIVDESLTPTFPHHHYETPPNKIQYLTDKSMTTRVATHQMTDTVRPVVNRDHISEWNILTVRQLLNSKRTERNQNKRSLDRDRKGISLSTGKAKKKESVTQKSIKRSLISQQQSNQSPSQGKYQYLRKLSMKGRFIDRIEYQTEEQNNLFC